jgi:hypothetical protein
MKKGLIITSIIAVCIVFSFYLLRNHFLPSIIAESIRSENSPPTFLPDEVKKTITVLKETVNERVDELPEIMKSLDLEFDDLLYIIDNVDADEVMNTLEELNQTQLQTTNQTFDIALRNIHIEGYDLEIFRKLFNEKLTLKRINKTLNTIERNQIQTSISIPVARNTAKQILIDNKERIEAKLDMVNGR